MIHSITAPVFQAVLSPDVWDTIRQSCSPECKQFAVEMAEFCHIKDEAKLRDAYAENGTVGVGIWLGGHLDKLNDYRTNRDILACGVFPVDLTKHMTEDKVKQIRDLKVAVTPNGHTFVNFVAYTRGFIGDYVTRSNR